MMTLDEAILHVEEVSSAVCDECRENHEQLCAWLKELRDLRHVLEVISPVDKLNLANKYVSKGNITDAE